MHYSAGAASLGALGLAEALPSDTFLLVLSRILLDGAGALFAVYLLAALVLSVTGRVLRRSARAARPEPR